MIMPYYDVDCLIINELFMSYDKIILLIGTWRVT
jgi:hypothetical protein